MKKVSIALLILCALAASTAPAFAEPPKDGMAIVADVLFARPVGLVSIVFGTAMYIVALPFSLPSGSVETAGQLLVADPVKYTFCRPLGDFDYKVGQAQMPKAQ